MSRPKKVQRLKLQPYTNTAGSQSWRITGTLPDGRRIRQNYQDKTDAIRQLNDLELEAEGMSEARRSMRTSLSAEQLSDAESASQRVYGQSLSKVVSHYMDLQSRVRQKGAELDQAISFFENHYRPETHEITILNAKEEYLNTRHGITAATRSNYDTGLSLLLKKDPNQFVHSFTVKDIEKSLSKYTNTESRRSFRIIYSTFFNWCVRHHYCLENPCKRLDKLPKNITKISMLSLDEVKRLLYASLMYQDGVTAASVAIGLFAGLRPSEIADLKAEDVGASGIRVSGGKLRRKLKRSTPIPPVLAVWLKKYPFTGLPVGWDYKMKQLKKATKANKWVQDIVRHTSISFQTERDKNEALTAYNNGTSVQMMNLHYRNTVDDPQALSAFWELTPQKILSEKPTVVLSSKPQIAWPNKKSLEKLVWKKPMIHAAKEIGVSDVALRKHCLKIGIELPSQGHWLRQSQSQAR